MKIKAKSYYPKSWAQLDRSVKTRFQNVEKQLRESLCSKQPTYDQLSSFAYEPPVQINVREAVAKAVAKRSQRSYSMTHEIVCFHKALREGTLRTGRTIYESASAVRKHLFGNVEPLRTFNMTITYHAKWMSIAPPVAGDPVFDNLNDYRAGSALFSAINVYLILLTSHPYSDGNGRTSRLMFNLLLSEALELEGHYVPLAELTRATAGIYEEYMANACLHGDFRQLIWLILALLESYAIFLARRAAPQPQSDLAKVLQLATMRTIGKETRGINEMPPFPISVQTFSQPDPGAEVDQNFLDTVMHIAEELSTYGDIQFALTGLADLTPAVSPKTGAIAFFINANQKEDLLLHFRELSAKHRHRVKLQVAVASGCPVIDAKLLFTLVSNYSAKDSSVTSCPVLLHDFHPQNCRTLESLKTDLQNA